MLGVEENAHATHTLVLPDHRGSESGLHLQFGYAIPMRSRFGVIVFGGPTHISVSQRLIADAFVDEVFVPATRTYRAIVSDPEVERTTGGAWGYNVGTDVCTRWAVTLASAA